MQKMSEEKRKKEKTLKGSFVRTYLLAVLLPVLLTGAITFLMVSIYKAISLSQPLLTLISILFPMVVLLVSVGVCFYCAYGFMMRQYEKLGYIADRLSLGRYDHFDYDLDMSEDNRLINDMNCLADKLADFSRKAAALAERRDKLENERQALQFSLLTAKSEPEFINRALAKLRECAVQGDRETFNLVARDMVELTQAQLADSAQLISLADEVSLVKRYIDIYCLMAGISIDYRVAIMCNIVDYRVIPHIVLPVVENFVEFAVRAGKKQYVITVEITSSAGGLIITIRDNGDGMSMSNLEQIRRELEDGIVDPYRSAISLPNINHRIKLYYGDKYGVKAVGGVMGNMITITLPQKKS